ncbi:LysR family transcriptional regulator [Chromobacterium haemolyticum]|uniref:LysR family transcriptional regulator n=1 Tax=Chromobacterium haemolyticum TaxID=394935 RepID=A0ABS3GI69_9NEIS|nr:LysR family transcriptional regulator [Chromobacterium haemolyticum]MBK0413649.1 LysR family transcriptional regulator [Chromobacterium haemolyticum]MBO0414751.1 LysR family transcriptional regulator [Chromobacterium haemolyticum]MBO0498012.1 LysR family transcriptional regulator [Chromobacterium haemolyticum]
MVSLDRFASFKAVVDAGSFTAAAAALGQTRAVVSFNIKRLEQEVGVALLIRNTRSLALTDAGARFYQRCADMLEQARLAVDDARAEHGELSGALRVTATLEYGLAKIAPAIEAFALRHPTLQVQLSTSSLHADLIAERFDVAIRLGRLPETDLHAAQLAQFNIFPVAAPALLVQEPPGDLAALSRLPWLGHSRLKHAPPWLVDTPGGGQTAWRQPGTARLSSDSASILRAYALAGLGVALLPDWLVNADLQAGRLRRLLPDHGFPQQGVHALYPRTRHVPAKVRAFIDFLREREAAG